ncbi:MAG TPA: hypothetical protein PK970_12460, partial [Hyphomicrobiaceae bacterium]|nr:hypothetical protein [Hyphomicrobiaceae bacterium]
MSVLLLALEPAPVAASMAIAEAGAIRRRSPCGPQRKRRTAETVFLASRGMGRAGVPARLVAWGGRP